MFPTDSLQKRISLIILVAAMISAVYFWNQKSPDPAPATSKVDDPVSLLEDIHLRTNSADAYTVNINATRVELKRDLRNLISFAGQYVIEINGLNLQYDIPALAPQSIQKLCKDMSSHLKVYPKSWEELGDPIFKNVTVSFYQENRKIIFIAAKKAIISPNGSLQLNMITECSDPRIANHFSLDLAAPPFIFCIYNNQKSTKQEVL